MDGALIVAVELLRRVAQVALQQLFQGLAVATMPRAQEDEGLGCRREAAEIEIK